MRLPRNRRMSGRGEFLLTRAEGSSRKTRRLILSVHRDPALSSLRVAFITPKHLGQAVLRNQLRRRLRHILQTSGLDPAAPLRIVTIARHPARDAPFAQLQKDWLYLARKLELPLLARP
ncbi:MAG: ribonuclease P protein component [Verrucomicrobiota bacterium]